MMPEKQIKKYECYKIKGAMDSKKRFKRYIAKENDAIKGIFNANNNLMKNFVGIFKIDPNYETVFMAEAKKLDKEISKIKTKFTKDRQKGFNRFEIFYKWFKEQKNTCCYCGITQDQLDELQDNPLKRVKRKTRGKTLEIERVVSYPEENNVYSEENCRLVCHVCNNAKSDFLSPKEFKTIAKGISEMWKNKNVDIIFNDKDKIWDIGYENAISNKKLCAVCNQPATHIHNVHNSWSANPHSEHVPLCDKCWHH